MKSNQIKTKAPAKTRAAQPVKSFPRAKVVVRKNAGAAAGKSSRSRSMGATTRTATSSVSDSSVASPGNLLRAGLSALSLPRAESAVADGLSRIADSFGLKKLEDVFDHRVAATMERMGYPSAKKLTRLVEQVDELAKYFKSQETRGESYHVLPQCR